MWTMETKIITLNKSWNGTGYVVLHQSLGFNFSSERFSQGMMLDGIAILFNKDFELDDEMLKHIKKLIKRKRKKKDESNILKS